MNLLVVSETRIVLCHPEGCTHFPSITAKDVSTQVELKKVKAVALAGLMSIEPLDLAFRLRAQYGPDRLPIIISGSVMEICKTDDPCRLRFTDLASGLQLTSAPFPTSESRRIIVDIPGREIRSRTVRCVCSPIEIRLMTFFLRYPDIVFSRMELLRRITSGWESVNPRMIDVLVGRLRRKIEVRPASPAHLLTLSGFGYMFRHNADLFVDSLTGQQFQSWPQFDAASCNESLTIHLRRSHRALIACLLTLHILGDAARFAWFHLGGG